MILQRLICRVLGHRWGVRDINTLAQWEPLTRCLRCGAGKELPTLTECAIEANLNERLRREVEFAAEIKRANDELKERMRKMWAGERKNLGIVWPPDEEQP